MGFVAVLNSYAGVNGNTNWYTIIPAGDVKNTMKQDADAPVNTNKVKGIFIGHMTKKRDLVH